MRHSEYRVKSLPDATEALKTSSLVSRRLSSEEQVNINSPQRQKGNHGFISDAPFMQGVMGFGQNSIEITDDKTKENYGSPLNSLEEKMYPDLKHCKTPSRIPSVDQRGLYWVLENYIPATVSFRCDESITYTTQGDFTFLDNLEMITSRWQVSYVDSTNNSNLETTRPV